MTKKEQKPKYFQHTHRPMTIFTIHRVANRTRDNFQGKRRQGKAGKKARQVGSNRQTNSERRANDGREALQRGQSLLPRWCQARGVTAASRIAGDGRHFGGVYEALCVTRWKNDSPRCPGLYYVQSPTPREIAIQQRAFPFPPSSSFLGNKASANEIKPYALAR